MNSLKKFFPTAFMFLDSVGKLILGIVIHFAAGFICGGIIGAISVVLSLTGIGLIVGLPLSLLSFAIGAYLTACIVISIIAYVQQNKSSAA